MFRPNPRADWGTNHDRLIHLRVPSSQVSAIIRVEYHDSIADADADADLGSADKIKSTFSGFQKYLYDDAVA